MIKVCGRSETWDLAFYAPTLSRTSDSEAPHVIHKMQQNNDKDSVEQRKFADYNAVTTKSRLKNRNRSKLRKRPCVHIIRTKKGRNRSSPESEPSILESA